MQQQDEISYWQYERIDAERVLQGNNFDNGEIVYKKFMSTAAKINLARSFIKLTVSVTDAANGNLQVISNLAPAFLAAHTLFKSMFYKINNVIVSEIPDYCAQIAALNTRLNCSKGYRDSILKDMNFGQVEFGQRQKMVTSSADGGDQELQIYHPGNIASTISVIKEVIILPSEVPLDVGNNTYAITAQTGLLTFAPGGGNAIPNVATFLRVGDLIRFDGANGSKNEGEVVAFPTAATVTLRYRTTADLAIVNALAITDARMQIIRKTGVYGAGILAARDNLVGTDTLFTTELADGDVIRVGGERLTVLSITDDLNARVSTSMRNDIAATENWLVEKKVNNCRGVRKLDLIVNLPLGIFQKNQWLLGHNFELSLFPHSRLLFKKFFMESLELDKNPEVDYNITIDNMVFYPCIGYVPYSLEQASDVCNFEETRMQIQNITSHTDIDRTFVIDNRTKYVTMALQDARCSAGNTLFPRTKFKVGNDIDLDLQSFLILYDIYQFPKPTHDQQVDANEDRIAQAYYENLHYSEQFSRLPDLETLSEFKKLGPYYRYKIPIRPDQSNPKLSIKTRFRNAFGDNVRPNILLFDTHSRSFQLIAKNGRVVSVIPTPFAK